MFILSFLKLGLFVKIECVWKYVIILPAYSGQRIAFSVLNIEYFISDSIFHIVPRQGSKSANIEGKLRGQKSSASIIRRVCSFESKISSFSGAREP